MLKYSKSSKIAFWILFAFFAVLVAVILMIFAFALKKYYLLLVLAAIIALSIYIYNIFISKYYRLFEDCIVYYSNNKEKLRIAYSSIDHAELIKRRERNVEFEQLKLFFENKKRSIRISYYDNVEELLDALYEHGVRFDLPADSISDKYIDYMRAKN